MTKLYTFYLRLLHPKAIAEKAAEHFSSLIFELPFRGNPPKDGGTYFLVPRLHGIFFE
jgi:hypothetical protein